MAQEALIKLFKAVRETAAYLKNEVQYLHADAYLKKLGEGTPNVAGMSDDAFWRDDGKKKKSGRDQMNDIFGEVFGKTPF